MYLLRNFTINILVNILLRSIFHFAFQLLSFMYGQMTFYHSGKPSGPSLLWTPPAHWNIHTSSNITRLFLWTLYGVSCFMDWMVNCWLTNDKQTDNQSNRNQSNKQTNKQTNKTANKKHRCTHKDNVDKIGSFHQRYKASETLVLSFVRFYQHDKCSLLILKIRQ